MFITDDVEGGTEAEHPEGATEVGHRMLTSGIWMLGYVLCGPGV